MDLQDGKGPGFGPPQWVAPPVRREFFGIHLHGDRLLFFQLDLLPGRRPPQQEGGRSLLGGWPRREGHPPAPQAPTPGPALWAAPVLRELALTRAQRRARTGKSAEGAQDKPR